MLCRKRSPFSRENIKIYIIMYKIYIQIFTFICINIFTFCSFCTVISVHIYRKNNWKNNFLYCFYFSEEVKFEKVRKNFSCINLCNWTFLYKYVLCIFFIMNYWNIWITIKMIKYNKWIIHNYTRMIKNNKRIINDVIVRAELLYLLKLIMLIL